MKINIKTKNDIDNLLNMLTSTEQTIIVRYHGQFLFGVYYSDKHVSWRFYFDNFTNKDPYDEFCLNMFRHNDDGQYESFLLNNRMELLYEIKDVIIGNIFNSYNGSVIPHIITRTLEYLGNHVSFNGKHVLLVGLSATLEDYYYYGISSDGKLMFESCVGGFDTLDGGRSDQLDHLNDPQLNDTILKLRLEHFPNSEEVEIIHL